MEERILCSTRDHSSLCLPATYRSHIYLTYVTQAWSLLSRDSNMSSLCILGCGMLPPPRAHVLQLKFTNVSGVKETWEQLS